METAMIHDQFETCRATVSRSLAITALISFVFIAALSAGGATSSTDAEKTTIAAVLSKVHVVEAVVTGVKPRPDLSDSGGRAADVTLEVTKVYCGEGIHTRDTFAAVMADGSPGFLSATRSRQVPQPIPKLGDTGIWQIYRRGDGGGFRGNRDNNDKAVSLPLLGHEGIQTADEAASSEKVAEAMRSIAEGRDEPERLRRLDAAARTGNRFIAVAAVWILDHAASIEGRQDVARRLVLDNTVPVVGRTLLDEMLCRWKAPDWIESRDRWGIFLHMAAGATKKEEFDAIGVRLFETADHGECTMQDCIAVLKAALGNTNLIPACGELYTFTSFAHAPHTAHERDATFEFFQQLLLSDGREEVKRAAAAALANVGRRDFPLTDKQIETVRRLRQTAKDDETAESLDEAFAIAMAKRSPPARPQTRLSN